MAGVKGMRWGQRKITPKKARRPPIKQRLTAMGADQRLYAIWNAMNARCYNPKNTKYVDYGYRGITVCDRWRRDKNNPDALYNFAADVGNPPPGRSLDRVNNDGGYSPDNVRWATPKEQAANARPENTRHGKWLIEYRAEKQALREKLRNSQDLGYTKVS